MSRMCNIRRIIDMVIYVVGEAEVIRCDLRT